MAYVSVKQDGNVKAVAVTEQESLKDALIREGFYINAVCAGMGRCGKCAVKVLGGNIPVSEEDRALFSERELYEGKRLSCTLYPENDISVIIEPVYAAGFDIVTDYTEISGDSGGSGYGAGIDIGTTTIAFHIVDMESGKLCASYSEINRQQRYGADVISRINAAAMGEGDNLRSCIKDDLKNGLIRLCNEQGIGTGQISKTAIAANTAMIHFLMGYDCSSLGQYPFRPANVGFVSDTLEEITGLQSGSETVLLPCVSAYIGADIVSGLYACDFAVSDDICLFIDIGTNGEMALGNRKKILAASAAAGPAFEGGNIKWGMGSTDGAVCSVTIDGKKTVVRTIKDKPPVGICGTGAVEAVAELLKEGLADRTGLLSDEYFENGFPICRREDGDTIVFTQKDIRELQLAKAAIRAGTEVLLKRYGITKEQVSRVYLAGGFGYRLDTGKAAAIGMISKELEGKIKAVGNTSLAGAVKFLGDSTGKQAVSDIVSVTEEILLPEDADFNELYIKAINF